jgi:cobalt-zinc-cadmium efflux system protein
MEVLAALVNGLTVFVIAGGILFTAWKRFRHPAPVEAHSLLGIAVLSLALNIVVAVLLYRRSHEDLNLRGAYLHVLGDALSTVAVLLAAVLMIWTGSPRFDAAVSVGIALVVLWGSGRLLHDALNTLLEAVPPGIRIPDVEREILNVPGIVSVHDLHVWSICSHLKALSGHVLVGAAAMADQRQMLDGIGVAVKKRFGIVHTTIQVESSDWRNGVGGERVPAHL